MNGEDFFNAINMIDDDLVQEAAFIRKTRKKNKKIYFSLAACLAVCVCAVVILSESGFFASYETAEDAAQNITEATLTDENILQESAGGFAPGSVSPESTTEIYVPETASPVVQSTLPPENTGSTPPSEAVTQGESVSSLPQETETGKTQDDNGNSAVKSESFKAKIIEINGDSVMVEPLESPESSSSDRIVFSKAKLEEINAEKGDTVIIVYDGLIMESYPAQIRASSWSFAE